MRGKQRGKGLPLGGVREEQPGVRGPGAAGLGGGPSPTQEASRPPWMRGPQGASEGSEAGQGPDHRYAAEQSLRSKDGEEQGEAQLRSNPCLCGSLPGGC